MSIEAHKCNVTGCKGYVSFENADFDFKNFDTSDQGFYMFDDPKCNTCGKTFYVVPHYVVLDIPDYDSGEYEELKSACMSEVDRYRFRK